MAQVDVPRATIVEVTTRLSPEWPIGGTEPAMSRMLSILVLVAILVAIGVIFFRVMSGFLVPVFLFVEAGGG